jgi:hypothetical protein
MVRGRQQYEEYGPRPVCLAPGAVVRRDLLAEQSLDDRL